MPINGVIKVREQPSDFYLRCIANFPLFAKSWKYARFNFIDLFILPPVYSVRCEIWLGKFAVTFFGLRRANFIEISGSEQIAYGIWQLHRSKT